jgi:hypothetical protein
MLYEPCFAVPDADVAATLEAFYRPPEGVRQSSHRFYRPPAGETGNCTLSSNARSVEGAGPKVRPAGNQRHKMRPQKIQQVKAAARQRSYRKRQTAGKIVLKIEVDEVETVEILVSGGFLAADAARNVRFRG